MNKNNLFYISGGELSPGMPMHIKIKNEIKGTALAFSSHEIGEFYLKTLKLGAEYKLKPITDISNEYYGKINLLVFNSIDEIKMAYDNQNEYQFSKHLEPWP